MKKYFSIVLGVAAAALMLTSCNGTKTTESTETSVKAQKGDIVFFNLEKVIEGYDMANDLKSVVETKVEGINQEVTRRGTKLEKDIKDFQDKIDKGLLTRTVAETRGAKLQEDQNAFQNYAAQKQQEIAEEQQVMMNQIADAIKTFIDEFNEEKQYALILTTQGDVLPAPVVAGNADLDITEAVIEGLNAKYIKEKNNKQ